MHAERQASDGDDGRADGDGDGGGGAGGVDGIWKIMSP